MQTRILPNFHSFPYLLMSSSRGKVKPGAHFLEMRLIWCPWMRLGCSDIHSEQDLILHKGKNPTRAGPVL